MMIDPIRSRYYAIVDTGLWSDYGLAIKAITDPESLSADETEKWNEMLSEHDLVDPPPTDTITAAAETMLAEFQEQFHGTHNQKSHGRRGSSGGNGAAARNLSWNDSPVDGNHTIRATMTTAGGHSIDVYRDAAGSESHDMEKIGVAVETLADLTDKYGVKPPAITIGHDAMVLAVMKAGNGEFSLDAAKNLTTRTLSEEKTTAFVAAFTSTETGQSVKTNLNLGFNEDIMRKGSGTDDHYDQTTEGMFNPAIHALTGNDRIKYSMTHEYGHVLYNTAQNSMTTKKEIALHKTYGDERFSKDDGKSPYGRYAFYNKGEFVAESFAIRESGLDVDGRADAALRWVS